MIKIMYLFCLIVWGLNFIAVKIQGTPVSLELSLLYRLALTAILFLVLIWFMKPNGKPNKKDIPFIVLFGVCNFALSYLCLYHATIMCSAAIVTLIFSLKVILTPIALRIFLKEKLHARVFLGGVFGILGVCILIYPTLSDFKGITTMKGILIALLGTVLTAVGDACSVRNASKKIDPIYANAIGFTIGSLLIGSIVYAQGQTIVFPTTVTYLSALMYLTFIASFLAWLFYLKLVEKIGGTKSGYMVALFPAIGGIASVIIGETDLSMYLVFGCLSSCIGALIALGFRVNFKKSTSYSSVKVKK
ncbi:DMT family transporter [Bacillus sp. FJAT-51639]|uniref:DMT family transporter n=2 Tax=Bacillaceae TaxID=186817 RepID=A0ABU8FFY3_9BACI